MSEKRPSKRVLIIVISVIIGIVLGLATSFVVWGGEQEKPGRHERLLGFPIPTGYFSYDNPAVSTAAECRSYIKRMENNPADTIYMECGSWVEQPGSIVVNALIWAVVMYVLLRIFFKLRHKGKGISSDSTPSIPSGENKP